MEKKYYYYGHRKKKKKTKKKKMGKKKHNNSASRAHLAQQNQNDDDNDDSQFGISLHEAAYGGGTNKQQEAEIAALPLSSILHPTNNPLCKIVFARRIALFTCRTYLNTQNKTSSSSSSGKPLSGVAQGNSLPSTKARHFVLFAAVNQAFSEAVREYHAFGHFIINKNLLPSSAAAASTDQGLNSAQHELRQFVFRFLCKRANGAFQWMLRQFLDALTAICNKCQRRPNDVFPLKS